MTGQFAPRLPQYRHFSKTAHSGFGPDRARSGRMERSGMRDRRPRIALALHPGYGLTLGRSPGGRVKIGPYRPGGFIAEPPNSPTEQTDFPARAECNETAA
jgi:hypothetical protein